ncbi:tRNA 2-thiouridine(34) synthase MnmA [Candidatus Peregrinibacteria bacterium]|nr:tRNA 2-thiouridine(34) synthase MnmA [Candidatus Peregrinibacteria bacterium]
MRILIAMSGGIDSSVVAHLLKEQGHDIIGVRFTLWTDPLAPPLAEILPSKCCNAQNISRADRVAKRLGIPLHILDLEEEFKREVVDPFLNGHRKGVNPNPCIGCNRTIKFGRLLEFADELGCEKLATGHYAQILPSPSGGGLEPVLSLTKERGGKKFHLLEALDTSKDQSYFLYGLTQKQLSRVLFPLGNLLKSEVYALADYFGIPYEHASYRESQDLCFFPEKTPRAFLKRHLSNALKPGPIVCKSDGKKIGTHQGVLLYAIGQRRLGVGGQRIPLEVVQKNYSSNKLIVDIKGKTQIKELKINSIRWVGSPLPSKLCHPLKARTHSMGQKYEGKLEYRNDKGIFTFASLIPPQSPGQHLVLYRGEEIVGGGVIT